MSRFKKKTLAKEDVSDYLILNPDFLIENPQVLDSIKIVHDSGVAVSLIQKQVEILRSNYNSTTNNIMNILEVAKTNEKIFSLTKKLILALINSSKKEDIISITEKAFIADFKATSCKLLFFDKNTKVFPKSRVKDPSEATRILGNLLKSGKVYSGPLQLQESNFIFNNRWKIIEAALVPLSASSFVGLLALGSDVIGKYNKTQDTLFLDFIAEIISNLIEKKM